MANRLEGFVVPASSAQRRMYFATALLPDSPVHIWGITFTVDGDLEIDRLERALRVIRGRHDALRITIHERDGEVFQAVHDVDETLVEVVEADGESFEERHDWARAEARRVVDVPFDLAAGPLWRTVVIRVAPRLHLLVISFHHVITDEISAQVFAEELRIGYTDPEALTEPVGQYSDFSLAENAAGVDPAGLDYWRGHLAGVQPARLPEDGRQGPDGIDGHRLPITLPENATEDFQEFCRDRGVSPFAGLLAVYFILLQRWAGTSDLTVGTQMFNRPDPESFRTIGFFANTVALRCQVAPGSSFGQFLEVVSETIHDALDHQDVPFEAVVDAMAPQRDAGRNPLFEAAISYASIDRQDTWALDGLQVTPIPEPTEAQRLEFSLVLDVRRLAGRVDLVIEYDRQRFSEAAMHRFGQAYGSLLQALCRAPDVPIAGIPTLDGAALAETLALGTDDVPPDDRVSVPAASAWDLFALTAATFPDREAVVAGGDRLTFAELADQARTMAADLRARGVRTGVLVGVCLPRRGDLIVAMLATWCAGGAFLLLDPQQPEARRRMFLAEAGVTLVVADESVTEVATGSVPGLLAGQAAAPAYVVFTSGSTGQPKGVLVDQASLVALATTQLAPMYARLPAGRQVNVGALSSVTFDVFVNHCLGMIAFGHRLLLLDEQERFDPRRLLARGADPATAIEVLDCNSSQMEILVDAGVLDVPYPPKMVLIGGESPSDRLWQRLHDQPGLIAFNMFGITECTIDSARAEIGEHPHPVAGRAAGTTRLYIVDDQMQLQPTLFVGEICIGGLGVAQGYVGQPAYTSERFVADPFSSAPGQRMYRTGDRGRLRPDGQLEFWGRLDDQIKVRGLRVEPGELEAALLRHPGIDRAAVLATDAGTPKAQLLAFIVVDEGAGELTPSAVREFLRGRLPSALLPDRVEVLDRFPATPNGKLDRAALLRLKPSAAEADAYRGSPPPTDPRARRLCEIVAEVVGVARADLDDNFFELGGNSLLAMMLSSRVDTVLGGELKLRTIFEARSLRDLLPDVDASA
ncbi:non-ribosomal peptide synthetase [Actinoplanes derwentensis]|uniref:Amino acid adenylation domain-containing protein n=1 Tax=Actinoplanes derwentensis TaxID=113562 RepID=A0A1H2CIJ9_9ACTN|nr:non-ribosomal peptide synthetase [Actinoplanes derwentensis]GID89589.1 hypothetical protein Ade03nite_85130 [Actinoplanes derwentensis]SDT70164.1 amino acid adenylation domain-containing protein [Actinoplanes derwentensis]